MFFFVHSFLYFFLVLHCSSFLIFLTCSFCSFLLIFLSCSLLLILLSYISFLFFIVQPFLYLFLVPYYSSFLIFLSRALFCVLDCLSLILFSLFINNLTFPFTELQGTKRLTKIMFFFHYIQIILFLFNCSIIQNIIHNRCEPLQECCPRKEKHSKKLFK